jgi:hypothetical protein
MRPCLGQARIVVLSWDYVEPEVGFDPTTFRLRVEEPSSSRCHPGPFWLLTSAGSSSQCVPDLPRYGWGNDQENDQTDPSRVHRTMATFRSGSEGRGCHREAHLPPPWSDGRSGTFRKESVAKASNSQLAQPQATRTAGRSMLSRVDQEGRIPDRSHTRGLSGTSRRSTPGLDRRSAAKRSPSSKPR